MVRQDVAVTGMTCAHCERAVIEEVSRIDAVTEVTVDLHPGGTSIVHVTSVEPVDPAAIGSAVQEAGYEIAGT